MAHGVDTDIGPQGIRDLFDEDYRIFEFLKIIYITLGVIFNEFKPIIQLVNDDYPPCTKEPRAFCCHDPYRAGTKYHHGISFLNTPHFCSLITCRHHIGKQDGIIKIHPFRNYGRAHIGIRDPGIFCLPPVKSSRSMGIPKYPTYGSSLGIGLVAVPI